MIASRRHLTLGLVAALMASGLALTGSGVATAQPVTCRSFTFQEDAQAAFDADRTGLSGLDRDRDGIACEALPRRGSAPGEGGGTGPGGETDPGGETEPGEETEPDPSVTPEVQEVLDAIAALRCTSGFLSALAAIGLRTQELLQDDALTPGEQALISEALADRLDELDGCVGVVPTPPATDPTKDDGSAPAVSGGQVSQVPAGSAATGSS